MMKETKARRLACSIMLLLWLCGCGVFEEEQSSINPDIVRLWDCCQNNGVGGSHFMAVWRGNHVYATFPLRQFVIDERLSVQRDSILIREGPWLYVTANEAGTRLLVVKSNYRDVSSGALYEFELEAGALRLLRDSTYNVSSAVYWPGDDARLVYYRYGQPLGSEPYGEGAGYYLLDLATGRDSLLLPHLSPMGPGEMLNGFDLHPGGTKLLVPSVQADPATLRPPLVVEYDLKARTVDTLDVAFELSRHRIGLWLRYSPDGRRILYANFPRGSYTTTTNDDSEVGLIDLPGGRKQVLDVNTNPTEKRSVQMAPTWSPDGRQVIYGSGTVYRPSGQAGFRSLYVLRRVD